MEKKSYRIRTTTDGTDKYLTINLDQSYDCLEILSLKISQDKIYKDFSSDYGVLVGRVIANDGYGIPNAKISVFIPIDDTDILNEKITDIYPYSKITDTTVSGVRYNLISAKETQPAGTFPVKQQFLDNETYLDIYTKYYKYTTTTNSSGDYMIFGVPIGQQIIHMDADLSDIGELSFTADSLVANGINKNLFSLLSDSASYAFKGGDNLEQLPQIISKTLSVDIKPLWGDVSTQQIGITRADFKINLLVSPVAYLTFAVGFDEQHLKYGYYDGENGGPLIGDSEDNNHIHVGSDGHRPGFLGRLLTNNLMTINAYKYDKDGQELALDETNYKIVNDTNLINKGIYIVILPCDLNKVITDEFGNTVLSPDQTKGIGTMGRWRIEIYSNNGINMRNFLLQKNGDRASFNVRSGRVYSLKMKMYDAYTIRDTGRHNIYNSNDEKAVFYPDDWLNGFLYFGYTGFDKDGGDYPAWLFYESNFYNIETRVIDVTDYLDYLIDKGTDDDYFRYNFKFYNESDLPAGIINKLKNDDILYGDANSSFEPSPARALQNRYIFLKGLDPDSDCFAETKKYINKK